MRTVETQTRIDVKNVLFPTDFSPAAAAAQPYAAEFAKRFGAKLYALHVRTPAVNPMTEPATWAIVEKRAAEEAAEQSRKLLESFPDVQPEVLIEEGGLWSTLESVIEKHKIDLIVLGTRGRGGVGKFFLGSTAEEIFRRASCPVLTVGPFSEGQPPRDGDIAEIVYATDFTAESAAAAAYAISLAQEFQAHLTMLHVISEPKAGDLVHPEELTAGIMQRLGKLVPRDAELWCEPRYMVERGPVAEKILQVAKRREADLIVLGAHRPTGFPGAATHLPIATAHQVVSHAPCPVLTMRG